MRSSGGQQQKQGGREGGRGAAEVVSVSVRCFPGRPRVGQCAHVRLVIAVVMQPGRRAVVNNDSPSVGRSTVAGRSGGHSALRCWALDMQA